MEILRAIGEKILKILQFFAVFIFIIFEEVIWEGIAEPIYKKIRSLELLHKLEITLNKTHVYLVLFLFLLLFVGVEVAGFIAMVYFAQGFMILGTLLYLSKIPIAGFTFWVFRVSQDRFMEFRWFEYIYWKIVDFFDLIKESTIYKNILNQVVELKNAMKNIKNRYFSKNSLFFKNMKNLYLKVKVLWNKESSK